MSLKLFRNTGFSSLPLSKAPTGKHGVRPFWLLVLTSVWVASACNLALWRELGRMPALDNTRGLVFAVAFGVMIAAATCALLALLAWRWTLKPAIAVVLLSAALGSYFMLAYGVVIDPTMMVNVVQTDPRETRDLLNWRLAASVVVLALVPLVWLWRRPVAFHGPIRQLAVNAILLIASLLVLTGTLALIFKDFSSTMRNHTQVRYLINPLNSFYALGVIATKPLRRDTSVLLPIGEDARLGASYAAGTKPPLLVLVLGETARSGNFALNGYERPTTPKLAQHDVVSLRNAWSCGTNTAASVPCMFSHLGKDAFESRKADYENLLDVLQRAGLAVLWVNNQSGCKGVCDRAPSVATSGLQDPELCKSGECYDEIMLRQLDSRIAALPEAARAKGVVVVLHQMGSHGPAYFKRSPPAFKKFMPECATNALQECPREQVVNAYDNTLLYTDHFVSATIDWLKTQGTRSAPAMVYVADHGESLGENNLYLHGLPYAIAPDVQKRVPWITWVSPAFEQRTGLNTACLKQQTDARVTHDSYFHSVLGLMDVQTALYRRSLDLYAACSPRLVRQGTP
jgi:lipid A ethanolaminephosphotransferase